MNKREIVKQCVLRYQCKIQNASRIEMYHDPAHIEQSGCECRDASFILSIDQLMTQLRNALLNDRSLRKALKYLFPGSQGI